MDTFMDNLDLLNRYLQEKKLRNLRSLLVEMNEFDIASFMEKLDLENLIVVFRLLPKDLATDVFSCLPIERQTHIINSTGDKELQLIIEDLFLDDAVDMLEELPATVVKRILQNATPQTRNLINQFLNYPENSAGSIMTAEYVALKKHMTVEEAFAYIRAHGVDKETIYTCYVTSDKRQLEGVVTLKDLLMNPYSTVIADIMDTNVILAQTTVDQEEVSSMFNKYDLLALPVVDQENRIVGIITVDDVVDVMEQEATEDIEKMSAILPSEKPYLKTSVFTLAKNRIVWLVVLMVSSMVTGHILASYEAAFSALPLLVQFIPMLSSTGGNAGSQSSALIIRGMTLGDIKASDIIRVLWKEVRVAFLCSMVLGFVNFIRLMIQYPGNTLICLTIVLSLAFTILLAKAIGCTLPIIAKCLNFDPAIMSAPIISTLVDACSLIVYFQIACALLPELH